MAGDSEFGNCDICGYPGLLNRKYYYYDVKCKCCNGKDDPHFELIRHCITCIPVPPRRVSIVLDPITEDGPPDPHEVSKVKCDLCGHEWVAVRPEGITELQCPNCDNTTTFENLPNEQS